MLQAVKSLVRPYWPWHPTHRGIVGRCTVSDLAYWTTRDGMQTVYPTGTRYRYDVNGDPLPDVTDQIEGTFWVASPFPQDVMGDDMAYWNRDNVGYVGASGNVSWVHGIDKTFLCVEGQVRPWYPSGKSYAWQVEGAIDLRDVDSCDVVLINRDRITRRLSLILTANDWTHRIDHLIPAYGMRRINLVDGVHRSPLTVRVEGLPTPWGRPLLITHFAGGLVDARHT